MSLKTLKSELCPKATGLENRFSICWLNSLIQSLFSCSALTEVLMENPEDFAENEFAIEYIRQIKLALAGKPVLNGGVILFAIMQKLDPKKWKGNQECSHDGFTKVMALFNSPKINALFDVHYECYIKCHKCDKAVWSSRMPAEPFQLIPIKDSSLSPEVFSAKIANRLGIIEKETCKECNTENLNTKKLELLVRAGSIMMIVLPKIAGQQTATFPDRLKFNRRDGTTANYILVSAVYHSGTADGGHYTAEALRGDQIFKCNDTSTYDKCSPKFTQPGAFFIMYHLV